MKLFLCYRAGHPNMVLEIANWIEAIDGWPTSLEVIEACKSRIRADIERRKPETLIDRDKYGEIDVTITFFSAFRAC